jgi:hypothetical protein
MNHSATKGDGRPGIVNGFEVVGTSEPLSAGMQGALSFQLRGIGEPSAHQSFAIAHEKPMHVIIVRSDLSGYQHVHPTMAADGTWSVPVTLRSGDWRVVADSVPIVGGTKTPTTIGYDLRVSGISDDIPLPEPSRTATVDGYGVEMKGHVGAGHMDDLQLVLQRAGKPVTDIEPYLAAYGHLVAMNAETLTFTHIHPANEVVPGKTAGPRIDFAAQVPEPGRYRMFFQFQIDGKVRTAEFTTDVTE